MVLDDIPSRERYGLVVAFAVAIVASGAVGYLAASANSPTGAFAGNSVSTDEVRNSVQSLLDQQIAQQEQQLALLANQSENISQEDVSIQAEVGNITQSEFPSLYRVEVTTTGNVPAQTGGLQPVNEEQVYYISKDGRYLFPQPTDLAAQQQQMQQQPQQPPATGQ